MMFTTASRDNDMYSGGSCAVAWGAPWWYNNCHDVLLTGSYGPFPLVGHNVGIVWLDAWGDESFAKYATMVVRPI